MIDTFCIMRSEDFIKTKEVREYAARLRAKDRESSDLGVRSFRLPKRGFWEKRRESE